MKTTFQDFLREWKFSDLNARKGEWKAIPVDKLQSAQREPSPNIDTELFDLIDAAYNYIGGHIDFRRPSDLPSNHNIWYATDTDGDREPDAVLFAKSNPYGTKWTGAASKPTPEAKKAFLEKFVTLLRTPGNFVEASDAIAHVLMTRYDVPCVTDKAEVERVIGKKVDWVGEHASGKYPKHLGFYSRELGGSQHIKILLGRPR